MRTAVRGRLGARVWDLTGGSKVFSIGREGESEDGRRVSMQESNTLSVVSRPHSDGAVGRTGRYVSRVRMETHDLKTPTKTSMFSLIPLRWFNMQKLFIYVDVRGVLSKCSNRCNAIERPDARASIL